jgi:hypothetical protein
MNRILSDRFFPSTEKRLALPRQRDYVLPAQFRTCLWPRASRWASGQEAGQPPREATASLTIRLVAGGETGAPRAQRGTRLKATTERASVVSPVLQRSAPKRLVHPCRPCGTGLPAPIQGSIAGSRARASPVSPSHGADAVSLPADAGRFARVRRLKCNRDDIGRPLAFGGERHDRAHPRLPAPQPR